MQSGDSASPFPCRLFPPLPLRPRASAQIHHRSLCLCSSSGAGRSSVRLQRLFNGPTNRASGFTIPPWHANHRRQQIQVLHPWKDDDSQLRSGVQRGYRIAAIDHRFPGLCRRKLRWGTGGIGNAVLDHSGQYIYVLLQNGGDGGCAAYQTYKINSDGSFTFQGDTEKSLATGESDGVGLPSILGNENFAYVNEWDGHYSNLVGFKRESSGTLQVMPFSETDPTLSGSDYLPAYPDASPTSNYVVVQLYPNNGGGDSNPPQLASYSVDPGGNLTTTNTSSNMPTPQLSSPVSTFSPDGTFIAFYAGQMPIKTFGNGIEVYNFNGASPLTLATSFQMGNPINQVAWDNSGHLYAISQSQNSLMDFDVNARSVGESAPVTIGSPFSMVVVSQAAKWRRMLRLRPATA